MEVRLNKEQKEAVDIIDGNVLVIAGAGTGKTRVLAESIINKLNHGISDNDIYAFTFTKKATYEMSSRLKYYYGENNVCISTFHSFTYNYLKAYIGPLIPINDSDKHSIITHIIEDTKLCINPEPVIEFIARLKNKMLTKNISLTERLHFLKIYTLYNMHLKEADKLDFDDMNLKFLETLHTDEFFRDMIASSTKYILVDECQDINRVQYEILEIMSSYYHNLFMVGDQDQCIYSFRGSDISIINEFIDNYNPKIVTLIKNYRSTNQICNPSGNFISLNENRLPKKLESVNGDGPEIVMKYLYTVSRESEFVCDEIKRIVSETDTKYKDIMILYRFNYLANNIEAKLTMEGIPHILYRGNKFTEHKEILAILNWFRLLINPDDDDAFQAICNIPKRSIGAVTLAELRLQASIANKSIYDYSKEYNNKHVNEFVEIYNEIKSIFHQSSVRDIFDDIVKTFDLNEFAKDYKGLRRVQSRIDQLRDLLLNYLEDNKGSLQDFINDLILDKPNDDYGNKVQLMSIHQSKGLEAKYVFVIELRDYVMPKDKINEELEEERRVMYVAMTRAKYQLYLLTSKNDSEKYKKEYPQSSFFNEIKKGMSGSSAVAIKKEEFYDEPF